MFEKKLEAGRHILTGKPIPLMRDGEEISGGYARWARAGRYSSSRPEGLFVYSSHCVGNGYGLLDGVRIYCRRHNWRRSVKMEEQKLIQMIRFDHDLVVFIEGSEALCDPGQLYPDTQGPASSLECGGWRNRLETAVLNTFFLMTANTAAM